MRRLRPKYYKQSLYQTDVTGHLYFLKKKIHFIKARIKWKGNIFKKGIMRVDLRVHPYHYKRYTKYGWLLACKQRFLSFYGNLPHKYLKTFTKSFRKKRLTRKLRCNNFLSFLESRLDCFLYRTNLVKTIFIGRGLIVKGQVLVNGIVQKNIAHHLRTYDTVSLTLKGRVYIKKDFFFRLRKRGIFYRTTKFCKMNYKLWRAKFISQYVTPKNVFFGYKRSSLHSKELYNYYVKRRM